MNQLLTLTKEQENYLSWPLQDLQTKKRQPSIKRILVSYALQNIKLVIYRDKVKGLKEKKLTNERAIALPPIMIVFHLLLVLILKIVTQKMTKILSIPLMLKTMTNETSFK